nr:hypothetical protein [Candidatus Sigynarchaeum springense]
MDLFSFVKKVAARLFKQLKIGLMSDGYKYTDVDFWQVLVWREMMQLSTYEAADDLNNELIEQARKGRGRNRVEQRKLGGPFDRREREAPHGSQVDAFLQRMSPALKTRLQETIIKATIDVALELGVITNEIVVYFDFTKDNFYGKDVFPFNPCITNIHDGKGTNRARKYAATMIASGSTWLFAGYVLTKPGLGRELYVGTLLQRLVNWGFIIKDIYGDREVSTFDVIATLQAKGLAYSGTMKHTPSVKKVIVPFLKGNCSSVVPHVLQTHAACRVKSGPIQAYLILKVDPGTRARDLRRKLAHGKITLAKAMEYVHVFITTRVPPGRKDKLVRWGMRVVQEFKKRWRIETGFRDHELFSPASHARDNATKTFLHVLDLASFNLWKIQSALFQKARCTGISTKRAPTIRRFSRDSAKAHVRGKNSPSPTIDKAISSALMLIR